MAPAALHWDGPQPRSDSESDEDRAASADDSADGYAATDGPLLKRVKTWGGRHDLPILGWATAGVVAQQEPEPGQLDSAAITPVDELPCASSRLVACSPRLRPLKPRTGVHSAVLAELLRPRAPSGPGSPAPAQVPAPTLSLSAAQILALCDAAQAVLTQEPTLLRLRAPMKIFGDLHGQYDDLIRLFDAFGYPTRGAAGDLGLVDYLFLGDYVDRGGQSLEVVCLLLALKCEHPRNVHLLRGNHESPDVNLTMGCYEECVARLGLAAGGAVWRRLNALFEWLPLAAVIENKILCVHGGIGRSLHALSQIEALVRPLGVEAVRDDALLTDLLWSDPTAHDTVEGCHDNVRRGPGVSCFGPDRVRSFCAANGLDLIVRAHECVMDGFERFASGHLVTVFSATNYCGVAGNAGALLLVGRDLEVVPKIIQPGLPTGPLIPDAPTRMDLGSGDDAAGEDDASNGDGGAQAGGVALAALNSWLMLVPPGGGPGEYGDADDAALGCALGPPSLVPIDAGRGDVTTGLQMQMLPGELPYLRRSAPAVPHGLEGEEGECNGDGETLEVEPPLGCCVVSGEETDSEGLAEGLADADHASLEHTSLESCGAGGHGLLTAGTQTTVS